ncbi:MAG: CsbD family protein [Candidatus Binatia bacterium]
MEDYSQERDKERLNSDVFAGWWKETRGSLRSWWGKLTEDDIEYIAGQKDRLVGLLQRKYGYAREKAQEEIERRMQETRSRLENTVNNARQSVEETAAYAAKQAAEVGNALGSTVQEFSETAAEQVKTATVAVGEQMQSLADDIRENAPQSGVIASAATTVADQVESAGLYLQKNDFANMTQDLASLVRRYPLPSLLVGVGVGYLFARRGER